MSFHLTARVRRFVGRSQVLQILLFIVIVVVVLLVSEYAGVFPA